MFVCAYPGNEMVIHEPEQQCSTTICNHFHELGSHFFGTTCICSLGVCFSKVEASLVEVMAIFGFWFYPWYRRVGWRKRECVKVVKVRTTRLTGSFFVKVIDFFLFSLMTCQLESKDRKDRTTRTLKRYLPSHNYPGTSTHIFCCRSIVQPTF